MKPTDIQIGKTYRNKGAGKTTRTVLDLGEHVAPPWAGHKQKVFVYYSQIFADVEKEYRLSLESFAQWAGGEVKPDDNKTTS